MRIAEIFITEVHNRLLKLPYTVGSKLWTSYLIREVKKIMHEDEILDIEDVRQLDALIMHEIVSDIINGTLLLEADSETLDMVLTNIWEMRMTFERAGVVVGDA